MTMLTILSPSKTQAFEDALEFSECSQPELLGEAKKLIDELKKLSELQIAKLMSISPKLAKLNVERFNRFKAPFSMRNARQALLSFRGDVYQGFELSEYNKADYLRAQKQIRILSGLYGVLRPLDLIQPYRLEMKTNLLTERASDLYEFWGDKLNALINRDLKNTKSKYLINLASNEYFKAIRASEIKAKIITPVFKEKKNGQYKVIALFAKRARGEMANYIIRKKISKPEKLKGYTQDGYRYQKSLSSDTEWFFVR